MLSEKYINLIKKIFRISIYKTVRFNYHYFGLKGIFKCFCVVSRNVTFYRMKGNVVINNAYSGCVKIGFADISLFDKKYERCIWDNTGEIVFNRTASIGHGSRIFNEGDLELGDNFTITANTGVVCCKRISFGNNCLISWDCLIMDTDFHKIIDINGNRINDNKDIVIGDNVWIGCRNLILKGTVINNDTVIAAGSSLVNHVFDDSNIIIGKRNEILKKGITWRQ